MYSTEDASSIYGAEFTKRCIWTSAMAVLYYDYVLTFSSEVDLFWTRLTYASFFYFANRYGPLLFHFMVFVNIYASMPDTLCTQFRIAHQAFSGVTAAFAAALLIMRTHALFERNQRVLIVLLVCAASACALSSGLLMHYSHLPLLEVDRAPLGITFCVFLESEDQGRYLAFAWTPIIVFDVIIFALTLTYRLRIGRSKLEKRSLIAVIFRDGIIYFGLLAALYIYNIFSLLMNSSEYKGIPVTYINILSSILVTRMMQNLRQPMQSCCSEFNASDFSAVVFVTETQLEAVQALDDVSERVYV